MSFRTRLTLFFVLIVIVPMVALGVVVVRLVSDSEQGKATARSSAFVSVARDDYSREATRAARQARALAADPALAAALRRGAPRAVRARATRLAGTNRLARVVILRGGRPLTAVGDPQAVAGGIARVTTPAGTPVATIEVALLNAGDFARLLPASSGVDIAVERGGRLLAAVPRLPGGPGSGQRPAHLPTHGHTTLAGTDYAVASFRAADLDGRTDTIAVLTGVTSTSGAIAHNTRLVLALLAAFLLLALGGALLVSRQLQAQLARLLAAAKRIGGGDLTATVPVQGDDELAALAREFNRMSAELARRIEQLGRERGRLRESIQRIGETFASGLDRDALLEIGVQTAVDAVEATTGRASTVDEDGGPLHQRAHAGTADDATGTALAAAERQALADAHTATARDGDVHALAAPLAREGDRETLHGVIAVARHHRPFDDAERELVASLARQTGLSLENVELHDRVQRQAVTDELTGLFNHRRFQEVIASEVAAAQRYDRPLALLLLDIDDFKAINDTHGHQQGDVVLRDVGRVLRECSREIDEPARYGGEEMAVALPQTDLEGAHAIAERVRRAVAALEIPRLDGSGTLRVTVSCGVAAGADDKDALVADADAALYSAKRAGKNRTVRAPARAVRPLPVGDLPR